MADPIAKTDTTARNAPDEEPEIRPITRDDIWAALAAGWEDFKAMPSHAVFIVLIYPVIGLALARVTTNENLLPLLYPLLAGFALLGPVAALGLYELSRRRERGEEPTATDAFAVLKAPGRTALLELTIILMMVFIAWLFVASWLSRLFLPAEPVESYAAFFRQVLTTSSGWGLIIVGNLVGFLFALFVFAISAVSFPVILDRAVDLPTAVRTSIDAVKANPSAMAFWGVIIAVSLALGSIPFFIGLAVVLPVLGHATWHLYRRIAP